MSQEVDSTDEKMHIEKNDQWEVWRDIKLYSQVGWMVLKSFKVKEKSLIHLIGSLLNF